MELPIPHPTSQMSTGLEASVHWKPGFGLEESQRSASPSFSLSVSLQVSQDKVAPEP